MNQLGQRVKWEVVVEALFATNNQLFPKETGLLSLPSRDSLWMLPRFSTSITGSLTESQTLLKWF